MNRKAFKQQRKRIRKLFEAWLYPLGLLWWRIDIVYHRSHKGFRRTDTTQTFARVTTSWYYMTAQIDVNVSAAQYQSDADLERAVVHELAHILVREMGNPDGVTLHEERVCTTLAKAFLWVRDLKQQQIYAERKHDR